MSEKLVPPLVVPIWENEEQPAPLQRSTLYPVTATLSVEAFHERFTCVLLAASVAVKLEGADGGVASVAAGVVDGAVFE